MVVPDAPVKVFLVATSHARAERRTAELGGQHDVNLEDTLTSLKRRDLLDSSRDVSPLSRADDAVEIDSTEMSLDEVIETVVALVRSALRARLRHEAKPDHDSGKCSRRSARRIHRSR